MKPTSLMISEGKQNIIKAINDAQLPPCIIKLILENINSQVDKLCYEEEQRDIQEYQKKLETEKSEKQEKNVKEKNHGED